MLDVSALIMCKCLSLELTKEHCLVFFLIRDRSCLRNKVIALFVVILGPILQPIEHLALTMRFWCTKFHPNIVLKVPIMNIISALIPAEIWVCENYTHAYENKTVWFTFCCATIGWIATRLTLWPQGNITSMFYTESNVPLVRTGKPLSQRQEQNWDGIPPRWKQGRKWIGFLV